MKTESQFQYLGSKAPHHDPDGYYFPRQHSGPPPIKSPRLRPLWPLLVIGIAMILMGVPLTTEGHSAQVTVGGLIMMLFGLGAIAMFGLEMGREIKEPDYNDVFDAD